MHPGVFLAEGLEDLGLGQAEFARAIGVSPMRISHVISGSRPVTAELALLFGKAFEQSPEYWLNLQRLHDLELAEASLGARLDAVVTLIPLEGSGSGEPRPVYGIQPFAKKRGKAVPDKVVKKVRKGGPY